MAQLTGLPRRYADKGIRRYGFHGLSYEFIVEDLRRRSGEDALNQRLIVAHLGGGASLAAIHRGRTVDTTMGFSALSGIPMGTRSGDLDPGLLLYLGSAEHLDFRQLEDLLYHRSGLVGLSSVSSDMRELLVRRRTTADVDEAIRFFCYRTRQFIGALAAVMGGLDRLIFTGGIGANSPDIRAEICAELGFLGIELDSVRNSSPEPAITAEGSAVQVEAVMTDEELMIARHARRLLSGGDAKCLQ